MDTEIKKDDSLIDKELFQKLLNESYNTGIERAIQFCISQEQMYKMIDPSSPVPMVIDSIIKTLHHFKKQTS